MITTSIILLVILVSEFSAYVTYGGLISKKDAKTFMDISDERIKLNPYSHKILTTNPYIAKLPLPILTCRYHVDGFGMVPRWSKLHRQINSYFRIATNKHNAD